MKSKTIEELENKKSSWIGWYVHGVFEVGVYACFEWMIRMTGVCLNARLIQ